MEEFELPRGASRRERLKNTAILVVEDSRYCSESLRLMAIRSGARVRRANCLKSARHHFNSFRPDVVFVDMGLPDGSGTELIEEITTWEQKPKVIAMSGAIDKEALAMAAGADFFVPKPLTTMATFQAMIRGKFQSVACQEVAKPEAITLREDLKFALSALQTAQTQDDAQYLGHFLAGLSKALKDKDLSRIAHNFLANCDDVQAKKDLETAVSHRLAQETPDHHLSDLVG